MEYKPDNESRGYVYFLKEPISNLYKIGMTKNIKERLDFFDIKLPFELEIFHIIFSEDCFRTELLLHKYFADKRKRGEWFNLNYENLCQVKNNKFSESIMKSIIGSYEQESHSLESKELKADLNDVKVISGESNQYQLKEEKSNKLKHKTQSKAPAKKKSKSLDTNLTKSPKNETYQDLGSYRGFLIDYVENIVNK